MIHKYGLFILSFIMVANLFCGHDVVFIDEDAMQQHAVEFEGLIGQTIKLLGNMLTENSQKNDAKSSLSQLEQGYLALLENVHVNLYNKLHKEPITVYFLLTPYDKIFDKSYIILLDLFNKEKVVESYTNELIKIKNNLDVLMCKTACQRIGLERAIGKALL